MEQADEPVDRDDTVAQGPPDEGHHAIDHRRPQRQQAEFSDVEALGAREIGPQERIERSPGGILQQHQRNEDGKYPSANFSGRSCGL